VLVVCWRGNPVPYRILTKIVRGYSHQITMWTGPPRSGMANHAVEKPKNSFFELY